MLLGSLLGPAPKKEMRCSVNTLRVHAERMVLGVALASRRRGEMDSYRERGESPASGETGNPKKRATRKTK